MNLENLNLVELNAQEVKSIDGGVFGIDDLLLTIAAGAVLAVISDWKNFEAGLSGRPPVKN